MVKIQKNARPTVERSACRHLLIFPGRFQPSIVSASGLNCRVRDGNGCTPTAIGTDSPIPDAFSDVQVSSLNRVSYTLKTE